jgi:tetratricopeptide (TPR) repeat protein
MVSLCDLAYATGPQNAYAHGGLGAVLVKVIILCLAAWGFRVFLRWRKGQEGRHLLGWTIAIVVVGLALVMILAVRQEPQTELVSTHAAKQEKLNPRELFPELFSPSSHVESRATPGETKEVGTLSPGPLNPIGKTNQGEAIEWFKRGQSLFESQDFKGMREAFNRAIEADPVFAQAYAWRGFTCFFIQGGTIELALRDYNKAIELDPSCADSYAFRAMLFASLVDKSTLKPSQDDLRQAIKDFEIAERLGYPGAGDMLKKLRGK